MRQLAILPVCTWVLAACCASGVFADDMDIARQLSNRLRVAKAEGNLRGFRINVKVEDSVVWLSGSVPNSSQQDLALQHAQEIPGVRLVVNNITVGDTASFDPYGDTAPLDAGLAELKEDPVPPVVTASQYDQALIGEPQLGSSSLASNRLVSRVSAASVPTHPGAHPGTQHLASGIGTQQAAELRQSVPVDVAVPANPGMAAAPYVLMPNYGYVGVMPAGMARVSAQTMPSMVQVVPAVVPAPTGQAPAARPVPIAAARPARLVNYHCDSGGCYGGGAPVGTPVSECAGGFCSGAPQSMGGFDGGMPQSVPGSHFGGGYGAAFGGAQYENPQMPAYAWPSYASHPNYAAVTYPRQYSPMAWPYIGPFYPYPQVPLGWRKVCLEWDDGWWMLDFKSKSK